MKKMIVTAVAGSALVLGIAPAATATSRCPDAPSLQVVAEYRAGECQPPAYPAEAQPTVDWFNAMLFTVADAATSAWRWVGELDNELASAHDAYADLHRRFDRAQANVRLLRAKVRHLRHRLNH